MVQLRIVGLLICTQLSAAAARSYVYQKDLSEYCRRRAVPSVFLSKNVAEANAEMLHFTKLDMPYSCYISIRTESSNNIIMVIQLTSGFDLVASCAANPSQLMVYEFGETFGGYWGPIPEAVVNTSRDSNAPRQYTLRTTRPTTTTTQPRMHVSTVPEETEAPKKPTTRRPTENDDVVFEVPLANVSGRLVPGLWNFVQSMDDEKKFDEMYDVHPGPQVKYDTSLLPLVQFSLHTPGYTGYGRRVGSELYDLNYNFGPFTPDYRLTTPVARTKSVTYRNRQLWNLKKRLKSKIASNAPLFSRESKMLLNQIIVQVFYGRRIIDLMKNTPAFDRFRKYNGLVKNKHSGILEKASTNDDETNEESYKQIEDLIHFLKKGPDFEFGSKINKSYIPIMKNIADMHHNSSAYLVPWSAYTYLPASKINFKVTKQDGNRPRSETISIVSTDSLQVEKTDSTKGTSTTKGKSTTSFMKTIGDRTTEKRLASSSAQKVPTVSATRQNNEPKRNTFPSSTTKLKIGTKTSEPTSNSRKGGAASFPKLQSLSGSLVDHESWENVVQAAPAIAGLLSRHSPQDRTLPVADTMDPPNPRRKRSLVPIPILQAKPHPHRTSHAATATASAAQIADIEYFAQLIELPDDEMGQRVALRYMRQYAGQTMFNICHQYEMEHKLRHLVLFNSSRIILALNNYTISRMTVVVTTARTLRGSEPRCPEANIECQVGGTRVCIDDTSACDGIPNCGALDIYDEDRLECGAAKGLMHNVYLAAFTFMALLLTGLYIVHYWLKRCVPKVADAFFIYTDGTENVLYLDTIMRSPTDLDMASKSAFRESFVEQAIYQQNYEKPKSFSQRLKSKVLKLMHFKQKHDSLLFEADSTEKVKTETRKIYSFTEMELKNITRNWKVDEEVQTGESLEMAFMKILNSKHKETPEGDNCPAAGPRRSILMLDPQRKKESRSVLMHSSVNLSEPSTSVGSFSNRPRFTAVDEEMELGNTLYDPQDQQQEDDMKTTRTLGAAQARKRLRFNHESRVVSVADMENDHSTARRSVVLPPSSRPLFRNINSLEGTQPDQGPSEIRSFFKGKKSKKKKDFK